MTRPARDAESPRPGVAVVLWLIAALIGEIDALFWLFEHMTP